MKNYILIFAFLFCATSATIDDDNHIGYLVNEGFCLNAGGVLRGLVGMIWGIGVHHDNEEIAFHINFTGTLRLN